jgi:hypothetical protein
MSYVCREKYVNDTLVSRLCMEGDIALKRHEFPSPEYVLSVVPSCDLCPTYPPGPIDREELKRIVRDIVRELRDSGEI